VSGAINAIRFFPWEPRVGPLAREAKEQEEVPHRNHFAPNIMRIEIGECVPPHKLILRNLTRTDIRSYRFNPVSGIVTSNLHEVMAIQTIDFAFFKTENNTSDRLLV
jgi:hypothetical protein